MKCMTDEDEHPESETDESTEYEPKPHPGTHKTPPPPTEAIIIKSSD